MPVRAYHGRFLTESLDSLLAQTSDAWRLLVITEPEVSRDLSSVVGPYLRDPRVAMIVNKGRKLAGAFNSGMRRASTDFAAILLGDDMWAPDAVAILTQAMRAQPDVDFFHSSRRIVGEHGEPLSSVHQSRTDVQLADFASCSPVKHLLCWRITKALSIGGMDETLNSVGVDDFDFPWSMAEAGAVFSAVPECLYIYRDHRSSFRLTTDLPLSLHTREIRRIMRKHRVQPSAIDDAVYQARRSYLRQCLYRSKLDRWMRGKLRVRPSAVWRETYS